MVFLTIFSGLKEGFGLRADALAAINGGPKASISWNPWLKTMMSVIDVASKSHHYTAIPDYFSSVQSTWLLLIL